MYGFVIIIIYIYMYTQVSMDRLCHHQYTGTCVCICAAFVLQPSPYVPNNTKSHVLGDLYGSIILVCRSGRAILAHSTSDVNL